MRWGLSVALLAVACANSVGPPPSAYFIEPYYEVSFTNTVTGCVNFYVVDGNRQGWVQQGCNENDAPLLETQFLSTAQVDVIAGDFAALPMPPDPACAADGGQHTPSDTITQLRHAVADTTTVWVACIDGNTLQAVYNTAATDLEELVQTPQLGPDAITDAGSELTDE